MEPTSARPEPLAGKLKRIEELAEKLVYIKWSREFFVLLLRATQDILALARAQPEHHKIVILSERLEQQINEGLEHGCLPKGAGRERLIALIEALCRALPQSDGKPPQIDPSAPKPTELHTIPLFSRWDKSEPPALTVDKTPTLELWLVAPNSTNELVRKLEQRGGFQVRFRANLAEVRASLAQSERPVALIIDLDHVSDSPSSLEQIKALKQLLAPETPLLFLADRGDITARIEAVETGGSGYFIKPVDVPLLLETLDERVLKTPNHRILIVDDALLAAREIARWLESRGMITQVLAQPLQILQAIANFRPNLLLLNLDLRETDGLTLAQAIQQHELLHELPMILLSERDSSGERLSTTSLSGETLLGKTLNPELLLAAVTKRLRQRHMLYRKLSQISNRDTISGLYNRPYFLAHLERVLVTAEVNAQPVATMLITLDNLRAIESHDVAMVDEIIEQAARRLQTALGLNPIAARFSNIIFAVLLSFTDQEALLATAHAVQQALETGPYPFNNENFQLRTSIGISVATSTLREATTLIQQADMACGMARDSKGTRIHIQHGQSVEQQADHPRQRRLLDEIREAVQQQRMNLLFQPVVSLRGDPTERYEVLLRMRNREGWELLPETVFALVKRHRIGIVLDRWVIAHSIRILRERQTRGHSAILFINISPTILQDDELPDWLHSGLQKTGVPAASLVFEITETLAEINRQALLPFLKKLKQLGCALSLDHFSGHERAQALIQLLGVDYVKLDPKFAQNLLNDKTRQQQLGELTRELAALGVTTIVTGIEDATNMPALWSCGIDYVQGYFLQRPHTDMSYNFDQTVL